MENMGREKKELGAARNGRRKGHAKILIKNKIRYKNYY
jgi:hypothetical protein